jgi:serine/threonine protein kinase
MAPDFKQPERRARPEGGVSSSPAGSGAPDVQATQDTSRAGASESVADRAGPAPAAVGSVPEQFGRYRILKTLGQGAMGAVFLAEDTQLHRNVALKIPKFSEHSGKNLLERFYREARAAATLRHAHICPVYDVGEIDGTHYLTMAFIEGKPLSEVIRKGKPLTERQAAGVVRKLALGLEEAHGQGVVHRDLKPANIMIDRKGEPVVTDFGLARQLEQSDESRITQTGAILGTPAYMSPEQVEADPEKVGPASDVYSLGVILYELLTGKLPFQGPVTSVLAQIVSKTPEKPASLRPGLDPALEAICLKMMARSTNDRYGTMGEVAEALTQWVRGSGGTSKSGETGARESVVATQIVPARSEEDRLASLLLDDSPAPEVPMLRRARATASSDRPTTRPWPLIGGGAGAGLVIVLTVILLVRTPTGTIRIELSDPSAPVEVKVDGNVVTLAGLEQPLRLEAREHELTVTGDNFKTVSKSFTVKKGDNPVLHVSLEQMQRPNRAAKDATSVPESDSGQSTIATLPKDTGSGGLRWRACTLSDASMLDGVVEQVNLIEDRSWQTQGDALIRAARMRGIPVILGFFRQEYPTIESRLFDMIGSNRDVVAGVSLLAPYDKNGGLSAEQLGEFGRRLKQKFPGISYWVSYTETPAGMSEPLPSVPPEVDVVDMAIYFAMSPEAAQQKLDNHTAPWRRRAGNRPLILRWVSRPTWTWNESEGLRTAPGTILKCAELAEEKRFAGLLLDHYGRRPDKYSPGIDQDPKTSAEARQAMLKAAGREISNADTPAPVAFPSDAGWISLFNGIGRDQSFNGRDLSNWKVMKTSGADDEVHFGTLGNGSWAVQNGNLVCASSDNEWLRSERRYGDFELHLEFRLPKGGNSGVYIRCPDAGHLSRVGMEIQINDDQGAKLPLAPVHRTGAIWGAVGPSASAARPVGEWNSMAILCDGDRVQVTLNGTNIVDADMSQTETLRSRPRSGFIGLSNWHGEANGTAFRNIRIRELNSSNSELESADRPVDDSWEELFNGLDLSGWSNTAGGDASWTVANGYVEAVPKSGSIMTKRKFGPDVELHAEFWLPNMLNRQGQARANSGIYILGRHEIQILDMVNNPGVKPASGCGALWGVIAPLPGASRPPETWQTFDISYRSPRGQRAGKVTTPGTLTVAHNGVKVIDDVPFDTIDSPGSQNREIGTPGPIMLQDHGAPVRFRNIRVRTISNTVQPDSKSPPSDASVFKNHAYKFFPEVLSWHQAKNRCEEMGGHLAKIESEAENNFVIGLAKNGISRLSNFDGVWLGATDERFEGQWKWFDGTNLTFKNWAKGQPNNKQTSEHFLLLWLSDGGWVDQPNESKQHTAYFVSEWDRVATGTARTSSLNTPPAGFEKLFNGKNLSNWKEIKPGHWTVKDGILHYDGKGDNLVTARNTFGDFELFVDWKIGAGGDSGIYLRGIPQVQIWDQAAGSGGLYNNKVNPSKPSVMADRPLGEWNTFHITMRGERVTIDLNDRRVVDDVILENAPGKRGSLPRQGTIELQSHGTPVQFRNIFVKDLSRSRSSK